MHRSTGPLISTSAACQRQKTKGENGRLGIGDFLFKWDKKDASRIPRPSGLIGPVRLVPLKRRP